MDSEAYINQEGQTLSGEELEAYCKKNGLCNLCAKTRTHKRQFKLLKKNKWQPLTVKDTDGGHIVYKGYCVLPGCFSIDQAKRLLGELSGDAGAAGGAGQEQPKRKRFRDRLKSNGRNDKSAGTSATNGSMNGGGYGAAGTSYNNNNTGSSNGAANKNRLNNYSSNNSAASTVSSSSISSGHKNSSGSSVASAGPIRISDDDVSVGSTLTTKSSVRRGLQELLGENAGTILDLSSTKLHHVHLTELVASFGVARTLTTLILENCKLNDNEVEIVANGLLEASHVPLERFSLRSNVIGNRGATSLYPWLLKNGTLQELDMSKNSIGSRGANKIITAFRDNPNVKIRLINFAHNEIWDADDGQFFASNATLKILNLEGNFVHDEGVEAIAEGIASNESCALEGLFLGWNGVGDEGTTALAQMLRSNNSLISLGLGENDITSAGARELLSALSDNKTLREITGLYHNLIDRKFIVVAIKRLLQTHMEEAMGHAGAPLAGILEESINTEEPLLEPVKDDLGAPTEVASGALVWEDRLYAPSDQMKPPMMELSFGPKGDQAQQSQEQHPPAAPNTSVNVVDPKNVQMPVKEIYEPHLNGQAQQQPQGGYRASTAAVPEMPHKQATPEPPLAPPQTSFDRLTVFQSSPLAIFDKRTAMHVAVPLQDTEYETQVIQESVTDAQKIGASIEVAVETSTVDNLQNLFSQGTTSILHLSCYGGNPDGDSQRSIVLENGFGEIAQIKISDLSRFVQSGTNSVKLVYISSFHARELGEAFVAAGIPHVVCCHHGETFRDAAATVFCRTFYRTLARHQSLKKAFHIAQEAVRVEGISKQEDRFRLLPQTDDDDLYHHVPVFYTQQIPGEAMNIDFSQQLSLVPKLPRHFIGREVDVYEILESLRGDDVVRVGGAPGSGKTCVCAAVCRYVIQRPNSFPFDEAFWLPNIPSVKPDEDSLYGDLCKLMDMMTQSTGDIWEQEEPMECRERVEIELEGLRPLMVIDGRKFETDASKDNLEIFLSNLLNADETQVKIILITNDEPSNSDAAKLEEEDIIFLHPLDFKSSSLLYGEISRFITLTGCPAAQTPQELVDLMLPPSVARQKDQYEFYSRRRRDLYALMGSGNPREIIRAGEQMPPQEFIELITIANYPEFQVESYGGLEKEVRRWTFERELAIRAKNYLRAMDIVKLLDELESLRSKFSSVVDLEAQEVKLKDDFRKAIAARKYDVSNALKKKILTVKRQIMQEKRARPEEDESVTADRLKEFQKQIDMMMEAAKQSLDDLTESVSASFTLGTAYHKCSLKIYNGSVVDFNPEPDVGAIVCWTNECCDITIDDSGNQIIERGGINVEADIASLPPITSTQWGDAKCGTGNAVIVGPGNYENLRVPCVLLAVGPLPSSRNMECKLNDEDRLHYIEIMMRSCIRSSLVLAKHSQLQAIAYPTLTTKVTGEAYETTLRMGLRIIAEEAKYSDLSHVHVVAASENEAKILIDIAQDLGLKQD